MYIRMDSTDIGEMLPMFFAVLVELGIVLWGIVFLVKKQDESKELVTQRVKVLEKPVQQGSIEWYVMECENGERLKLRSFQANHIMITVGDVGTVSYRGQTIQDFKRQV